MLAYVFPGQGSQRKGMGEGLFDQFPELTIKADEILEYSIQELCLQDPGQKLNQTQYTQPALYTVNALTYLAKIQSGGRKPDYVAGHSLGEYNALHAAGVIGFETGLSLVKKRGKLMGEAQGGGMAAVMNCPEAKIRETLAAAGLDAIDIANFNSPSQIIISGLREHINQAQAPLEKADAKVIPLNTSGAFHSRYMRDSAAKFAEVVQSQPFGTPEIPVIANVTARPYLTEGAAQLLIDQICNPVRWNDSVLYLLDQGVVEFEEIGVGDVLTKLIAAIRRSLASAAKKAKASTPASERPQPDSAPAPSSVSSAVHYVAQDASALVEAWNRSHPIGAQVTSDLYDGDLETRTEAVLLFGHRAAVYMKGYNGYFDLREVKPAGMAKAGTVVA